MNAGANLGEATDSSVNGSRKILNSASATLKKYMIYFRQTILAKS
jgi:hypothetical protein